MKKPQLNIENTLNSLPEVDTTNILFDFEKLDDELDKNPLKGFNITRGTAEISTNITHDGVSCAMLLCGENGYNLEYELDTTLTGAVFCAWIYDDLSIRHNAVLTLSGNDDLSSWAYKPYIGWKENSAGYNAFCENGNGEYVMLTGNSVLRTKGWHKFEFDMSSQGKLTFKVDNELLASQILKENEFAKFHKFSIADFEWSNSAMPVPIYVDDISIILPAPKPQKLIINDKLDTFDWVYDKSRMNVSDYEYSLDSGNTYQICKQKPLYVGNINLPIGALKLRVKASESLGYTYASISNEQAFTHTDNADIQMERQEDIAYFNCTKNCKTLTLSQDYSHSGLKSLAITPCAYLLKSRKSCEISKQFDKLQKGKIISIWVYDELKLNSNNYSLRVGFSGAKKEQINIGFSSRADKNNFYLICNKNFSKNTWKSTNIQRTEGWHCFSFDFSAEKNKLHVYIDNKPCGIFEIESYNNFYVKTDLAIAEKDIHNYYIDDISIVDNALDLIKVQKAPTNFVVNDKEHTFSWDAVPLFEDISLYEYSCNNGETFQPCVSNPQKVSDYLMPAGTVMVRLRATATLASGAVLRSHEDFTDTPSALLQKIYKLVHLTKTANAKDYTPSSWNDYKAKLEKAAQTKAEDLQRAYDELYIAKNNLKFNLKDEISYIFEDKILPVQPLYGKLDWGDTNKSFLHKKSLKINTQTVHGNQWAQLKYTFLKPLEEKQISFYFWDAVEAGGDFSISISSKETGHGNKICSTYENGKTSTQYMFYDIVNHTSVNKRTLSMDRRENLREIEINLSSEKGALIYMDTVLVFSNPNLLSIDCLDFVVSKTGDEAESTYLALDELIIREKNPTKSIDFELENDTVNLGYYETYEMNVVNYKLTTEKPYPTTDKFSYHIADTSVAYITKGGSIQPVAKTGTTTATITSHTGASKTITVNVHNYKAESIKISDSLITQKANYISALNMQPNEIKIVNAIITPANVTNRRVDWTSSDTSIATVVNGEIKTHAEGDAIISAVSHDSSHTASVNLCVKKQVINYGQELFVATNGDDKNGKGTFEMPFASLERARDEIRKTGVKNGGVVVNLRGGTYVLNQGFLLQEQDSGSKEKPVKYTAYKNEKVVLTGSFSLTANDFKLVDDNITLDKLQNCAKGKVYVADIGDKIGNDLLKGLSQGAGLENIEVSSRLKAGGINVEKPYYSVSLNGKIMDLARWPNPKEHLSGCEYPGFSQINKIPFAGKAMRTWWIDMIKDVSYQKASERNAFGGYSFISNTLTKRMKTWKGIDWNKDILDEDIWYLGYPGVSYASQTSPIKSISENGEVFSYISALYWAKVQSFSRLYVYNLIQELDVPGEWYIDKKVKKLYLIPFENTDMSSEKTKISVSTLTDTMITLQNAKYITIENLNMEDTLGQVVNIQGGHHNKISRCNIKNTPSSVGEIQDYEIQAGMHNGFEYCTFIDVNGGIDISAGTVNRHTLIPAYNFVHACYFERYQANASSPTGIKLWGVGNFASCNELCNAPNNSIWWQGNDNVVEFNNIHHVDLQATDASAMYSGRDVLMRGTVVRNNYIHHIGKYGDKTSHNIAIYIDDIASGMRIYDNVIEACTWAIFINGGQDNQIYDNSFINCLYGVIATDWSFLWRSRWWQHGYGLLKNAITLKPVDIDWQSKNSPYSKYPYIQTTYLDNKDHSIYNKVINNNWQGTDNLFEFRVRGCQPDTVNVLKDWYFSKDNYKL